jgi:hypothetical protein
VLAPAQLQLRIVLYLALALETLVLIVTRMRTTCKNPDCPRHGKQFMAERASARYCSVACRVAAHRKRQQLLPAVAWSGKVPGFRAVKAFLAEQLLEIAERDDDGQPKTGRRYYYLALSHGYISPDMGDSDEAKKSRDAAYDRVTDVLGTLRKQGRLGWDMVLDLTRELDEWQTYDSTREARSDLRRRYSEDRWLSQLYYPILVVEKDTMEPVAKPMARRWQMPFASSRGYGSLKLQHDIAELIRHRYAKFKQGSIIYFVSDLDPSGLDLQRAWQQAMDDFGVSHLVQFVRIALTMAQVRREKDVSGRSLQRLSIAVKPSDSRSERYIEQNGNKCWEVDILPSSVIERDINIHIEGWLNAKLWSRRESEIERARELL